MADCCILITIYRLSNVFSTATDGGVSIQKHVLLFAKRAIKPVQGRTGLILPRFSLVSFCLSCSIPAVLLLSSKTASALSKRQKGYRFNRCPQVAVLIYVRIPHTAVTGYGGALYMLFILQKLLCHLNYSHNYHE